MKFAEGKQELWNKGIANQVDDDGNPEEYGLAVYRYAERWADMMDHLLEVDAGGSKERSLADVADSTHHAADTEGISGFMYGEAVRILSAVWVHGEELRRWHNAQYDAKANDTPGAVINPAILAFSV
jgi:predicted RNA-binding protein associated with RNAse of E/G family